ncbi:C-terminal processing protease CtpA/Prc [Flavobacterium cutihirudinis]|uniref:C-terminal processing protease CtpA/Prc n=1 Tax=Flavobacterium cutihirudinis TaxID=1265740 RepID=A0A3D9FVW0_9FLAO|nr:S41 family peptidase [Flavobacterium cutihirudinis]RED24880.1 C-terminal processing protease CtpA/Prc [Flavobacterium cutihirudinis]
MSKTTFSVVFFIFSFLTFGQNESNSKIETKKVENLTSLAKVWGFLKYYHPNVAKGNFNWDEQLIQMIPKVEQAQNKEELSKIYINWIAGLGEVKECKSCKNTSKRESFDENFDLSWTQNPDAFTTELSQKLKFIEENRFQGKNKYITTSSDENVLVTNEPSYTDFKYPDRAHRIASFFRYWNIVEYFFPYKYVTDQKWDSVLTEMIPKFENAGNEVEYHLAMLETVVKLGDSHANFFTEELYDYFGRKYIPGFINVIENKAVITGFYNDSLAKLNDLRIGDVIEEVNDRPMQQILEEKAKFSHGSNKRTKNINYDFTIFNGSTDSVKLKITRNGIAFTKMMGRYKEIVYHRAKAKSEKYSIDENNIGYINMDALNRLDVDEMMEKMKSTNGIIIDVRNYPNFFGFDIVRRIISSERPFARLIYPDLTYPGKFFWEKPVVFTPNKSKYYSGKVVVLVNEETQSRAEFFAMALQSGDNVTTIGSQTAAADGDITKAEFFGFKAFMSGLGVFYPDGRETQRVGVKVDVEVFPTIKGIQEGKDEVLEAAKEYLKNI